MDMGSETETSYCLEDVLQAASSIIINEDVMMSSTSDMNLLEMNDALAIPAYDSEPQPTSATTDAGLPPSFEGLISQFSMDDLIPIALCESPWSLSPSPRSPSLSPRSPSPSPRSPSPSPRSHSLSPRSPSPSPRSPSPSPSCRPAAGSRGSKRTRNRSRKQLVKCDLPKMFECQDCGKRLKNKNGLRKHAVTHMERDELPYKCDYCLRRFGQRNNLTRHIGSKHELRNLKCRNSCGKTFHRPDKLKLHEMKCRNGAIKKQSRKKACDDEE